MSSRFVNTGEWITLKITEITIIYTYLTVHSYNVAKWGPFLTIAIRMYSVCMDCSYS